MASTASQVKERPILFSTPMVRAILDGTKTQTRRPLKIQPLDILTKRPPWDKNLTRVIDGNRCWFSLAERNPNRGGVLYCSHGEVGERLWVREKFSISGNGYYYVTDTDGTVHHAWRPSIHMPREASRITLEITGVRVQRIQDISAKDIIAEGAVLRPHHSEHFGKCPVSAFNNACYMDLKTLWADGWNAINARRGFGWEKNPWCWCISFKRVQP